MEAHWANHYYIFLFDLNLGSSSSDMRRQPVDTAQFNKVHRLLLVPITICGI